jgi:hypothetical protein
MKGAALDFFSGSQVGWLATLPISAARSAVAAARAEFSRATNQDGFYKEHTMEGDVVIHFRCGDIVHPETSHGSYGLLPFAWYARQIPQGTKRIFVVGNFKMLREIDRSKVRPDRCNNILHAFTEFLTQLGNYDVAFVSRDPITDFLLLTAAPTFIGSISTFSAMAGLLSQNNATLPQSKLLQLELGPVFRTSSTPAHLGVVHVAPGPCLRSGHPIYGKEDNELVRALNVSVSSKWEGRAWALNRALQWYKGKGGKLYEEHC